MIPDGYEPLFRSSPFLDVIGPVYCRKRHSGGWKIGVRVADKHCNGRGTLHGGVLSALADIALGYNAAFGQDAPRALATVSLTIDYTASAYVDDWLELECDLFKQGRSLVYGNAFFWRGGERIARANAIFRIVGSATSARVRG